MKRMSFMVVAILLAAATSASASTRTYFGFQIGVGNAPPAPMVRYVRAPRMVFEPDSRVYVVEDNDYDYDMFRYGDSWYICDDGYWYRSDDYRGPFVAIDVRYVPRPIFYIPANHVRHEWRGGPWWQHRIVRGDFAGRYQGDGRWDRGRHVGPGWQGDRRDYRHPGDPRWQANDRRDYGQPGDPRWQGNDRRDHGQPGDPRWQGNNRRDHGQAGDPGWQQGNDQSNQDQRAGRRWQQGGDQSGDAKGQKHGHKHGHVRGNGHGNGE